MTTRDYQETYLQSTFSERIGGANYGKGAAIYKFEKIKRAKRAALEEFPERELLDFGIGENDDMAPEAVRATLSEAASEPNNRGYADNGILEFKEAAASFMKREFGVELDSETEINHAMGCKSALTIVPGLFIDRGDITLMTVPGYPVSGNHTKYYGGEVFELPLLEKNNFLPDLRSIPEEVAKRAKLLVINYPNSPTGALATETFYKEVVDFAKKNSVVVVQDATHAMLAYNGKPSSFLQTPGAKDVGIECHSMSKGFNMIGWRMGFVAGNPLLVSAFCDFKDNCDSGQFIPIQLAATEALLDTDLPKSVREKYQRRLQKLVSSLNECGFQTTMPGGTFFLYVKAPTKSRSISFANAEEVTDHLIRKHSIVTVPWDNAGAYIRFSVTYQAESEAQEDRIMEELKTRLLEEGFVA